jgi:hypothetical protein
MKSLIKHSLTIGLAAVFTLGAVIPSFAHKHLDVLGNNYMAQNFRGNFRIAGHGSGVHQMTIRSGLNYTVLVNGGGNSDLDVWVYDGNGTLVGSDESPDDQEEVSFEAQVGGTYTIRVSNIGQDINTYELFF